MILPARKVASLVAVAALASITSLGADSEPRAETVVLFDPQALETPESIVFDSLDNAYITLALTGQVVRVSQDGRLTLVTELPIGAPCGSVPTLAAGLAVDDNDRLFAAVSACDPANSGIWEIDTGTGEHWLVAVAPSSVAILNGLDVHGDYLYAADSLAGLVWRVSTSGGSFEVWVDDPLLKIRPGSPFPGPNGLQYYRGSVYVANSSTGAIVRLPIGNHGSSGEATVHVSAFPLGCDEFTFDVLGRIYCATGPFNKVLRLTPGDVPSTVLDAGDLLDVPTSVAFGRRGRNKRFLYIANAAFPFATQQFRPSLMRLPVDIPGDPREY